MIFQPGFITKLVQYKDDISYVTVCRPFELSDTWNIGNR